MGCLTRIGCAVILVAGGAVGYWLYGDRLPTVLSRAASGAADRVTDAAVRASERYDSKDGQQIALEEAERRRKARAARERRLGWVTVTTAASRASSPQGVAALKQTLAPLRARNGPAWVSLSATQIGVLLAPLLQHLPPSATSVQIALDDDELLLRGVVDLQEFAGTGALATVLGGVLADRDTVFLAGPIEPVRPGLAQFRVRELRLKGVEVPPRFIPTLVRTLREHAERQMRGPQRRADPVRQPATGAERERTDPSVGTMADPDGAIDLAGLADDGLPMPLPASVSDMRVANGKLTLYRATPASGSAPSAPLP